MKLYWGSGSPVSWRIQLALALKSISCESHRLDLGSREHRGDAFRAINPRGTFPVLVDGDLVVRESLAILAYLERKSPTPALFGESPADVAIIWQHVLEHDKALGADVDTITRALFRDDGLDGDLSVVHDAVQRTASSLQVLAASVETTPWLYGDQPSALEVVNYPTFHRLLRAASKPRADEIGLSAESVNERYPTLFAWAARLAAMPRVDDTYPPHWRA